MDMYRLFENTNAYAGTATSNINNTTTTTNNNTISIGRGLSRDEEDGIYAVDRRGGVRVEGSGREQDGGRAWWMRFRPSRIFSSTAALRSVCRRQPPRKTSATTLVISHPHFSGQGALVLPPASSSSSITLTTAAATSSLATVNQASPSSNRSHRRLTFGDTFGGEEVVDDLPDGISLSTLSDGVTVASLDVDGSKEKTGMSGHDSTGGVVNRNTTHEGEGSVDGTPGELTLSKLYDGVTSAVDLPREKTDTSGRDSAESVVSRNTTCEGERSVDGAPGELTLSILYDGVTSAVDLPCEKTDTSGRDSAESVVSRKTTLDGERSVDGAPGELTLSILYDGVTSAVDLPCERTSGRDSAESIVSRNTTCDGDSAVDHLTNSVSMSALSDGVCPHMDGSRETPSTSGRDRTERVVDTSTAFGGASTLDTSEVDAEQGQHNVNTSSRPLRVDIERELVERIRKKIGDNPKLTSDDTSMPVSINGAFTQSPQEPENKYGAWSGGGQRLSKLLAKAERESVEKTGHHPKRMLHDSSILVPGGEGSTALRSTEFPQELGHDFEIEAAGEEGGSEIPTNDGLTACVSFLDTREQSLQYNAVVFRNHESVAGRDYGHLCIPDNFEFDPDDEHSREERFDDDEESLRHRCLEKDNEGIRRRDFETDEHSRHQKLEDEDEYVRQQRMTDNDQYLRKQTWDHDEYTGQQRMNEDAQHPHPVRGCPSARKADQENVYHILQLLDRDLDDYLPLEASENSTEIDSLNNSTSFSLGRDTIEGLPYLPTDTLQKLVRVDSIDRRHHLPTRRLETCMGADSPNSFPSFSSHTHNDLEANRAASPYLLTEENNVSRRSLSYCLPSETEKNVNTCGPSASFCLASESSDTCAEVRRLTGSFSHPHYLSERSPLSRAVFQPNGETHTFGLNPLYSSEDDQTSTEDHNSKFNSETDSYEINPFHSIFNTSLDPPSLHAGGMTLDTKSSSSELVDQGSHRTSPPRGVSLPRSHRTSPAHGVPLPRSHRTSPLSGVSLPRSHKTTPSHGVSLPRSHKTTPSHKVSLPRSTHVKADDRQLLEELISALDSLGQNGTAANSLRKKFFTVQRRKAGLQPEFGQRVIDMSTPKFYTLQRKRDTSRAWKAIGKLAGSVRSKLGSKNDTLIGSLKSTFGRKSNKVIGSVRSRGTVAADRRFSMEMALPTGMTKLTLSGGRKPLTMTRPTQERGSGRRHSCKKSSGHFHYEPPSSTSSGFNERTRVSSTGEGSGRPDSSVVALEDDAESGGNSSLTEGMDRNEEALFGTSPVLLDMANLY